MEPSFWEPWVHPQVLIPVVLGIIYLLVRRYLRTEEEEKKKKKAEELHDGLNLWVNDGGGTQIRRIIREEFSEGIGAHEQVEKKEREAEREVWRREFTHALVDVKTEIEKEGHRDCDRIITTLKLHDQRLAVLEKILDRRKHKS